MALFWTDSLVVCCSNVEASKQWWIETFDCVQAPLPAWDNPLPSDVALKMPGHEQPTVLLSARSEYNNSGLALPSTVPILFTNKVKKAQEHLSTKNVIVGPIQDGGGTEFFEMHDIDGNLIEICKES